MAAIAVPALLHWGGSFHHDQDQGHHHGEKPRTSHGSHGSHGSPTSSAGNATVTVPRALLGHPAGLATSVHSGKTTHFTVPLWVAGHERDITMKATAKRAHLSCHAPSSIRSGAVSTLRCDLDVPRGTRSGRTVRPVITVTTHDGAAQLPLPVLTVR